LFDPQPTAQASNSSKAENACAFGCGSNEGIRGHEHLTASRTKNSSPLKSNPQRQQGRKSGEFVE